MFIVSAKRWRSGTAFGDVVVTAIIVFQFLVLATAEHRWNPSELCLVFNKLQQVKT